MKTIKFSEVVKRCGEPSIYLAWVDPARDQTWKRALVEHRVMTLHQELHGGKKDFGLIGFLKDRHAQLLVFPRSLRRFSERKVIAIDYALIAKDQMIFEAPVPEKAKRESRPGSSRGSAPTPDAQPAKIPFRKSKAPAQLSRPASNDNSRLKAAPALLGKTLSEVKRAATELAAGRSVPAYNRLKRLLESMESRVH